MTHISHSPLQQYGFSQYSGKTDKGRVRNKNEDNLGLFPEQGLFFVADGVGGMPAGEVASKLVVEVLPALLKQRLGREAGTLEQNKADSQPKAFSREEAVNQQEVKLQLKQAIIDLSNRLASQSQIRPEYSGMATTLVLAQFIQNDCYIAHLGDSRAYSLKNGTLQQLTNDHTLVRHLLMAKAITQEAAANHPGRNQLVQYIGMAMTPKPDVLCIPKEADAKILLCSDGLTDMLSKQEISQCLKENQSTEMACEALVKAANLAGGRDNITVVLIE